MPTRRRKVFGPLFYSTLVVAFLVTSYVELELNESTIRGYLRERSEWQQEQALLAELKSEDSIVRERALAALLKGHSSAVVPYLVEAARDPRREVRALASRHLTEAGADLEVIIPVLVAASSDADDTIRLQAALAFDRIRMQVQFQAGGPVMGSAGNGTQSRLRADTIKVLRLLLRDRVTATRIAAADALGQFDADPGVAADLVAAAEDTDRQVQLAAARALLRINGPGDPTAGRILVSLMGSRDPVGDRMMVLETVKSATAQVQREAMTALASLLTEADHAIHPDVIDCLVAAGPLARSAVPALEQLLLDKDPEERNLAGVGIAKIEGKTGARTLPILLDLIADVAAMREKRQSLIEMIRQSNAADLVKVTPILIRQLGSRNPQIRADAMEMLGTIIGDTPAEMPAAPAGK
jgi:HEAT repeat protein